MLRGNRGVWTVGETHHLAVHGVYPGQGRHRGREQRLVDGLNLRLDPPRRLLEDVGEVGRYWVSVLDHLLERKEISNSSLLLRPLCYKGVE